MVVTRGGSGDGSGAGDGSGSGSGAGLLDDQTREFISSEITRSILEQTPVIFGTIKEGILEVLDERLDARLGAFRTEMFAAFGTRTLTFREFRACGAPEFFGEKDPIVSRRWIADIESAQMTSFCPEGSKVRFAACLLRERARDWWEEVGRALGGAPAVEAMTWPDFVARFRSEFAPVIEIQQLAREFQDLRQTTETVAEITAMFRERALLVPQYAADEEMKKARYHDMLREDIREFVSISACRTLEDMISRAREREIDLEHLHKRKSVQGRSTEGPAKRPKTFDSQLGGHQGRGRCAKCGRTHEGNCRGTGRGCFSCGQTGHFSRDCPRGSDPICFHCNQVGHKKTDCPRLTSGAMRAPAPATLRITDGREGRAETPAVRGRAFQLQVEETRVPPDVAGV